eukprot:1156122-Pelagomonas_calceolata.AAC.1
MASPSEPQTYLHCLAIERHLGESIASKTEESAMPPRTVKYNLRPSKEDKCKKASQAIIKTGRC